MNRKLRILLGAGLLFSELHFEVPLLHAQEASMINGDRAVRFEQSPGFFHYAALCRAAPEFMPQMPPSKLLQKATEPAVCWYVKASSIHAGEMTDTDPIADGKLVISAHHIRFIPRNAQFSYLYADLDPKTTALSHRPGWPYALLRSNETILSFRFSKLCPSCAAGTPIAPGFNPVLLDQEFSLLEVSLKQFDSGWEQIYRLSSGIQAEVAFRHTAGSDGATGMPLVSQPGFVRASKLAAHSTLDSGASKPTNPDVPVNSHRIPAVASGLAAGTRATSSKLASSKTAIASVVTPSATGQVRSNANPRTSNAPAKKTLDSQLEEIESDGLNVEEIEPQTAAGMLVRGVEPTYPIAAKQAGLEGKVVVRVIIGETGEVCAVGAISGPLQLEFAAVDAIRRWRYRPYLIDGRPVKVETTIEVGFALGGSRSDDRAATRP